MNLATRVLQPREFADRPLTIARWCNCSSSTQPQLIVLAGFMRILTSQFIGAFAGRILNVHPSLLPKYRGLHTHRRALEAGEALHGVSVHFVTEELDGGPVVLQAEVPILPDDTRNDAFSASSAGRTQDLSAGDRLVRARAIAAEGRSRVARRQAAGCAAAGTRAVRPAVSQRVATSETECESLPAC